MAWLRKNYKTVTGALIVLILIEAVIAWYLIEQFRENYLSGEEAFSFALADAGLPRDAVSDPDVRLRTKDGRAWYEITFAAVDGAGAAFRYGIDAETGAVLSRDAP